MDANNVVDAKNMVTNDSNDMSEINHNPSSRFSKPLILAPNDKQSDSSLQHGSCLELVIAPYIMLVVAPLTSCMLVLAIGIVTGF